MIFRIGLISAPPTTPQNVFTVAITISGRNKAISRLWRFCAVHPVSDALSVGSIVRNSSSKLERQQAGGMPASSQLRLDLHFLFGISAAGHSDRHLTGTSNGLPLSLSKVTSIFAGLVVLAFRSTT